MIKHLVPIRILLVILLCLPMAAGCSRVAPAQVSSGTTGLTDPVTTEPVSPDKGPSGTLRLWWDYSLPENPLLTASPSGRAVYSLVFGQLFQTDSTWQLQPELVQTFAYSEERLQLTLSLRQDIH